MPKEVAHDEDCPAEMRGRHTVEIETLKEGQKELKEGQSEMREALRGLTDTLKEYIELNQKSYVFRIEELERRQTKQEDELKALKDHHIADMDGLKDKVLPAVTRVRFCYYVIITTAGALIAAAVGMVVNLMWANATKKVGWLLWETLSYLS